MPRKFDVKRSNAEGCHGREKPNHFDVSLCEKTSPHSPKKCLWILRCGCLRVFPLLSLRSAKIDELLKTPAPVKTVDWNLCKSESAVLKNYEFACQDMSKLWARFGTFGVSGFWQNKNLATFGIVLTSRKLLIENFVEEMKPIVMKKQIWILRKSKLKALFAVFAPSGYRRKQNRLLF